MTHFSDFSFLGRAVADFCVLLWSILHIYNIDRFEALRWRVIKRKEVKSLMTILFLLAIMSLLAYDIICTKIKYTEGFAVDPLTKNIISKPEENWSPENKKLRHVANRLLMLFYALENSAVFLLQNFWNYLANKIVKSSFITTWQFRINYAFIFIAFVLFNLLPIFCENDDDDATLDYSNPEKLDEEITKHTYEEVIPELAAAACNLIVLVYALMAHFKFNSLIKQNSKNYIVDRLKYYRYMNFLLILIVAFGASLMITICADGLTKEKYLNRNKFTLDLFAAIVNFFMAAFWIVWLMIFYPRFIPTYSSKQNDYAKLSSPITSPTFESSSFSNIQKDNVDKPLEVKRIEIKVDSTVTSNSAIVNNYDGSYNNEGNTQDDGYVQPPLPLATSNRQVISYTGSPRQYHSFV